MELKPGYKLTAVGVIPEDWRDGTVGQLIEDGIIEKPLDGNHGNIHPKSGDFVDYGIPFVMANNVHGGQVVLVNCSFIRKKQADSLKKGFSRSGDVLLTHKATIGNTAIVGEIPFPYVMLTPQVTYYRVADKNRLNNLYLRHFFDSTGFQSVLKALAGGGTRAYIGIKAQHQLPVVLPPTEAEQRAIAGALSDVDALIGALDRLLAKKRDLKQAAMQQLLTGHQRLPGFAPATPRFQQTDVGEIPEDWDVKPLAQVFEFESGKAHEQFVVEHGRFVVVNSKFISSDGEVRKYATTNFCRGRVNDILMVMSDLPNGKALAKCFLVDQNDLYAVNQRVCRLKARKDDPRYLHYVLNRTPYFLQFDDGVQQTHLLNPIILKCPVVIPPNIAEQTAIAEVLSDMDAELAALEQKRDKTRLLKQGMMQELLTGRTRLV